MCLTFIGLTPGLVKLPICFLNPTKCFQIAHYRFLVAPEVVLPVLSVCVYVSISFCLSPKTMGPVPQVLKHVVNLSCFYFSQLFQVTFSFFAICFSTATSCIIDIMSVCRLSFSLSLFLSFSLSLFLSFSLLSVKSLCLI